jgi:hypothetical protein
MERLTNEQIESVCEWMEIIGQTEMSDAFHKDFQEKTRTNMLTNEQIAENMLSDIYSYRENIKNIIIGRLMDSSHQRTYWDAWFRGAKGKDLENADKGIIFINEKEI